VTAAEKYSLNRTAGAGDYFTDAELDVSRDAGDTYGDVTPEMLFSRTANAQLAIEVRKKDPVRYAQLKQLWRIECGEIPQPNRR
jgi:hypothetical protein